MAQDPPATIDVTDIQFKVHDRFTIFNAAGELRSSLNLLATASNYGLMFVGNPSEAELKVILIKDLIDCKASGKGLHARQVQLPNLPNCIAVSCDGSMLAVNYSQNGCGFVAVYSVPSFTTANIKSLHNIRLPGDDNIMALQLLWNPVVSGSLAVVMSNGALGMYDFKNNSCEFHTLDSKEQINCGSWSPKGKQIVLGFPNGKLAQYKPDLRLARTIPCPPNIHPGPFRTISVQWLSTFQFAVVFLQQSDEASPTLYIVHAPKVGSPKYTNYFDICYSSTGPRVQQVNLLHIQPWNLLLVTSANGVEVGLLGTKETTEAPTWVQYTLLDEARIELPLTEDKDETYPIGFALDTSSTHQLTIAEKKMPLMPMIHILSTHGQLVTFDFLNLQPNTPDICSPPSPHSDTSGMSQFKPVNEMLNQRKSDITISAPTMPLATVASQPPPVELSFATPAATLTPALEKPKAIFGTPAPKPTGIFSNFGPPNATISFGNPSPITSVTSSAPSLFKTTAPVKATPTSFGFNDMNKQADQQVATFAGASNVDKLKPLYTVPPTFTAPSAVVPVPAPTAQQSGKTPSISPNEVDDIVNEMISLQIASFDLELRKIGNQSKGLLKNIGSTDEMKRYTKRLNDLQEIVDQANEREFESDLQSLRNLLNESFAMLAECRSKLNMYNNPDIAKLTSASNCNPVNRRQLAKLNSYLANNQAQLHVINAQIDAQWSTFQDLVRHNSRTQMHTPCLEGIYQRLTKLKDMIARERTKLNFIKSKLREKGLLHNQLQNSEKSAVTMESLTDTILSMSLAPAVEASRSKLTNEKLNAIRELLANRKITIIKPQRPDRVGLKSEVILETKLKSDRKIRDGAATNMDKMEQERIKTEQQRVLTKPTATKAVASSTAPKCPPNAPARFGAMSPFVKPSPAKNEEHKKDLQQQQQPPIVKPVASTAAPMFLKATPPSTTASLSAFSGYGPPQNINAPFSGFPKAQTTMPTSSGFGGSFSMGFSSSKTSSNVDSAPKEQTISTSFAPKPMSSDPKPFSTSNFSSPFSVVAPSKTTESIDKENKAPAISKPFMSVANKSDASLPISSSVQPTAFASALSTPSGFSFSSSHVAASTQASTTASPAPFSFSLNSALNSGSATPTTASTTSIFGGLAKPTPTAIKSEIVSKVSVTQEKSDISTESNSDSSGITFSSLNLGTLGLPSTPDLSPTPSASTVDSVSQSSAVTVKEFISDPTDSLFGDLNICKPTSTETGAFKSGFGGSNLFVATSSATDAASETTKSIFGSVAVSKEPSEYTGFASITDSTKSVFQTTSAGQTVAAVAPASTAAPTTSTTSAPSIFAPKTTKSFSFASLADTSTAGSIVTGQVSSSTTAPSVFSTPSSGASIFAAAAAATPASSSSVGSMFGGIAFGTPKTASIFGTSVSSASSTLSTTVPGFGSVTSAAASVPPVVAPFGTAATTSSSSIFASAVATTTPAVSSSSGSIFGGIPKPDQSVFRQSDPKVFGSPSGGNSTSGGSLFGGQTPAFGSQSNTGSSIFGGSAAGAAQIASPFGPTANTTGGNIFGSSTPSSPNVFGTPPQPAANSGGSIFDQSSATSQSGGSLFGGTGTQSGFGSSTSPFGGNAASGGSIFGGSATATSPKSLAFGSTTPAPSSFGSANTGGFGLFSQTSAFGSPTQPAANVGAGTFAQGGTSITQTGFGSPTGGAAFAKPVFGGAPAFGSPPTFGSGATFGSPKGFGSFAAPAPTGGAFTSPTFEALGSTDQGMSFEKLAQNTNANQQKPAFGGSSFMSYRS